MLGAPVRSFAYPYGYRGAYTDRNVDDVRAAGITDAYSNFGGAVRTARRPYRAESDSGARLDTSMSSPAVVRWAFGD